MFFFWKMSNNALKWFLYVHKWWIHNPNAWSVLMHPDLHGTCKNTNTTSFLHWQTFHPHPQHTCLFSHDTTKEYVLLNIPPCFPTLYRIFTCNGPYDNTTWDIIIHVHPDGTHWLDLATSWSKELYDIANAHMAELCTHLPKLTNKQSWWVKSQ